MACQSVIVKPGCPGSLEAVAPWKEHFTTCFNQPLFSFLVNVSYIGHIKFLNAIMGSVHPITGHGNPEGE